MKAVHAKTSAVLKMVISMVIFGSIGFISPSTGLPSFELVFIRCICATLFLGLGWMISGQSKKEKWNSREVVQTLACGFFLVFNWVFLFKSFEGMSVTVAISIYHLAPIIVLILGSMLYKERLNFLAVFSILICFVGTVFITGIEEGTSFDSLLSSGFTWALLAALFYACTTILGKGIRNISSSAVTFLQTGLGIFVLIPFVHFGAFIDLTATNWVAILVTGFIHTGFVFYLFFDSLRVLPTKLISVLVFLDPAVAILLDTVFTGFRPTVMQTSGIVFIFAGMALSLRKSAKAEKPATEGRV